MITRRWVQRGFFAGLLFFLCASQGVAQIVDLYAVGYAGPKNDRDNGESFVDDRQRTTGPLSGSWIGGTGIHDVSTPGIGAQGTLQYTVNGGHTALYQHTFTEQTGAATDNAYVALYTAVGTEDYVRVTGLPRGTAVNVNLVFAVSGNLSGEWPATLTRAFRVTSTTWGDAARLFETWSTIPAGSGAFDYVYSVMASMVCGYDYAVFTSLSYSTSNTGGAGFTSFATLDSTHSANVRLYPQGPGLGLTSLSGFDYTSPVPEPASMFGVAGLCVLFVGGRLYWRSNAKRAA